MPDSSEADYIISLLAEIGEAKSGESLTSIDWLDIKAFSEVMGIELSPWEAESLMFLSSAYVSQYYMSMDVSCLSPNIERLKTRDAIAEKMKNLITILRS